MAGDSLPSRRTLTSTESAQFRRPLSARLAALQESPPPSPPRARRRSSAISLDSQSSISSARRTLHDSAEILHPPPEDSHDASSLWQSLPLAFALLPALAGLLFHNGSAVVSDILLLGLAAVFLNWSVRLPWDWYRSAQQLRTLETLPSNSTISNDAISPSPTSTSPTKPDIVPHSPEHAREIATYLSAQHELRTHELLALLSCVVLPPLGALLLHTLRGSLHGSSGPGLVSNFNLVVFLLAAELRPVGQLLRLVRARTLWLQRVVRVDPRADVDARQDGEIEVLRRRVEVLEDAATAAAAMEADGGEEEAVLARVRDEVRRVTKGEVEALSRAVRRYERRAGVLAERVEGRLGEVEERLGERVMWAVGMGGAAKKAGWVRGLAGMVVRVVGGLVWGPVGVVSGVLAWVFGRRAGRTEVKMQRDSRSPVKPGKVGVKAQR